MDVVERVVRGAFGLVRLGYHHHGLGRWPVLGFVRNGRCWVYGEEIRNQVQRRVGWEWRLGLTRFGISVVVGGHDDDAVAVSVWLVLLTFHVGLTGPVLNRWAWPRVNCPKCRGTGNESGREGPRDIACPKCRGCGWDLLWETWRRGELVVSLSLTEWRAYLWQRVDEWRSRDVWYRRVGYSVDWPRVVLGAHECLVTPHTRYKAVPVPFYEGCYPADVQVQRRTWTRDRWAWWPVRRTRLEAEFAFPYGVPKEGKGESAHDCGEDATYSTCRAVPEDTPAAVEDAAMQVAAALTRGRRERAGVRWLPARTDLVISPRVLEAFLARSGDIHAGDSGRRA